MQGPLRPIQLVREEDARPGATARNVPIFEPTACKGCPQVPVCAERGARTVFLVEQPKGKPVYCQKIGSNLVACKARHQPALEPQAEPTAAVASALAHAPTFLCDASVFINAERWQWKQCQLVLERAGTRYKLATTRPILGELHYAYQLPAAFDVIDVNLEALHPRLLALAQANQAYEDPSDIASLRDLSLVQAMIEHPELHGILTEDADLRQLHTPSVIRELTGRDTLLMTCEEFCRSKKALFPELFEGHREPHR